MLANLDAESSHGKLSVYVDLYFMMGLILVAVSSKLLQWSPSMRTPLRCGHLRYYMYIQPQRTPPSAIPVLHKEDISPSTSSLRLDSSVAVSDRTATSVVSPEVPPSAGRADSVLQDCAVRQHSPERRQTSSDEQQSPRAAVLSPQTSSWSRKTL